MVRLLSAIWWHTFPPFCAAKSTVTEPGFIAATMFAWMSFGAALPGIRGVRGAG